MVFKSESTPALRGDLVLRQLDDDWVVYDPQGNLMHVLNLSAVAVYNQCDGDTSVTDMSQELARMYETAPAVATVEQQVVVLLDGFRDAGLLA